MSVRTDVTRIKAAEAAYRSQNAIREVVGEAAGHLLAAATDQLDAAIAILLKPGKLEPDEWAIMKKHASIGARLLDGDESDLMRMAHEIALTHHEKWDGTGYPNGLAGEAIPMAGRIAAIADVFDALTSERPYKKPWTVEAAVELIRTQRGQHFAPEVVDAFMEQLPQILGILQRYADAQNE